MGGKGGKETEGSAGWAVLMAVTMIARPIMISTRSDSDHHRFCLAKLAKWFLGPCSRSLVVMMLGWWW